MDPWEDRWQVGDTPWDHGKAAPPLLEYLERESLEGRVLVPGCGSGHEVRALAKHGAEVVGMDIAPTAIKVASSHSPSNGEVYELENFLSLPARHHGKFDCLVEHTCFCAIDPAEREDYVKAAHQALKPHGKFFGIFFIDVPDPEHEGPPFMSSLRELSNFFDPYFHTVEAWRPNRVFEERKDCLEQVRLMVRR